MSKPWRLGVAVIMLVTGASLAQHAQAKTVTWLSELGRDSILVNKALTSRKYKVKIYPGATQEVLFFNASGEEGKVYQFFIFDMEGNLVKQAQIRNKQTTILTNFNKGSYTFEVFSDDEHIENGTLTIK